MISEAYKYKTTELTNIELYKSKLCETRIIRHQAMATTQSPAVIMTQPLPLEVALGAGLVLPGKNWQPIACPDPVKKESPSLARLLGDVKSVLVNQKVEKVEAATRFFSFNCCKVETENSYQLKDASSGGTLLEAVEDSAWCLRNPCLCCDCVCWCCHSECGSRRAFTLTLAEQEGAAMQLEMSRPCRSDCLPCCLQSITVSDSDHQQIGLVRQVLGYSPPFEICGKFEVCDAEGEVVYVIRTPCLLTTCWCNHAEFVITNTEGREVAEITKSSSNVAKEFFTDGDRSEHAEKQCRRT